MSAGAALLLLLIGALVFTQTVVGGAVARIRSFETGEATEDSGPTGSAFVPRNFGRKALRVARGVARGDRVVFDTIMPACMAAGGGFTVISWYRPTDSDSCHRFGKGTEMGALDIQPPRDAKGRFKWERADRLVTELRQTPGVNPSEIIFRGDSKHDPELGAEPPHVHAGVNCG